MTARDIASGLSCLFEALVVAGYLAVAWIFLAWVMLLVPLAAAGIIILWAYVRSRFDD